MIKEVGRINQIIYKSKQNNCNKSLKPLQAMHNIGAALSFHLLVLPHAALLLNTL